MPFHLPKSKKINGRFQHIVKSSLRMASGYFILHYIYNNIFPDKKIEKPFDPEKNIVSGFNIYTINYCYWRSLSYNICPW